MNNINPDVFSGQKTQTQATEFEMLETLQMPKWETIDPNDILSSSSKPIHGALRSSNQRTMASNGGEAISGSKVSKTNMLMTVQHPEQILNFERRTQTRNE
jgi:hypothetical protein